MTSLIERLRAFVDAQAKQENLWFEHEHITEAILQRALRAAHDALEHAIAGLEAAAALSSNCPVHRPDKRPASPQGAQDRLRAKNVAPTEEDYRRAGALTNPGTSQRSEMPEEPESPPDGWPMVPHLRAWQRYAYELRAYCSSLAEQVERLTAASKLKDDLIALNFNRAESAERLAAERVAHLKWALAGIDLVANGLRNRRGLGNDDVEMINLKAARDAIDAALSSAPLADSGG